MKNQMSMIWITHDLDDIDVTGGAWGDDNDSDLDLDDDLDAEDENNNEEGKQDGSNKDGVFVAPSAAKSYAEYWTNSNLAVDHVCAGEFDSAMDLLNRQIGVVNFKPMKSYFVNSHLAVRTVLPGLPSTPSLTNNFLLRDNLESTIRNAKDTVSETSLHAVLSCLETERSVQEVSKGLFDDSSAIFLDILMAVPLVVVKDREEANEIKELVGYCKEYLAISKSLRSVKKLVNPIRSEVSNLLHTERILHCAEHTSTSSCLGSHGCHDTSIQIEELHHSCLVRETSS